jgi:hypothetical protein
MAEQPHRYADPNERNRVHLRERQIRDAGKDEQETADPGDEATKFAMSAWRA